MARPANNYIDPDQKLITVTITCTDINCVVGVDINRVRAILLV
jgi:hypothetical protein